MEGVTGSIPVAPTKNNYNIRGVTETALAKPNLRTEFLRKFSGQIGVTRRSLVVKSAFGMRPIHRWLPNRIPTLVVNRRFDRPHPLPVTGSASQALDARLAAKVRAAYATYEPTPYRPLTQQSAQLVDGLQNSLPEETAPRRDRRGRFLKRLDSLETASFPMSDDQIRAAARRILSHCPTGTKKPLALACGFKGEWALL